MKKLSRALTGIAILALLNACGTVQEHRARQFSADWNLLDAEAQSRIATATIQENDTNKAVYIALGSPNYTLPYDWSSRTWTWVYWGSAPDGSAPDDTTLRFLSRGEIRLPAPKSERQALRVTFENQRVLHWELAQIDPEEARQSVAVEMGKFPLITRHQ